MCHTSNSIKIYNIFINTSTSHTLTFRNMLRKIYTCSKPQATRAFCSTNMVAAKPTTKPASPDFSSGPCKKRPGWTLDALSDGAYGRSHRSALGKAKLKKCIEDSKRILGVPDDYLLGIVPVSPICLVFFTPLWW